VKLKLSSKHRQLSNTACVLYEAIENRLYCGKYPAKNPAELRDSAAELGLLGIDTIVDFTEPDELTTAGEPLYRFSWTGADAASLMRRFGLDNVRPFKYVNLPVRDDHPPSKAVATRFCKLLDAEFDDGRRVYIHCRGGIGRTATMLACYLMWTGLARRTTWRRVINGLRWQQKRSAPMPLQCDWLNSFVSGGK
jgi:hypothetical protein